MTFLSLYRISEDKEIIFTLEGIPQEPKVRKFKDGEYRDHQTLERDPDTHSITSGGMSKDGSFIVFNEDGTYRLHQWNKSTEMYETFQNISGSIDDRSFTFSDDNLFLFVDFSSAGIGIFKLNNGSQF